MQFSKHDKDFSSCISKEFPKVNVTLDFALYACQRPSNGQKNPYGKKRSEERTSEMAKKEVTIKREVLTCFWVFLGLKDAERLNFSTDGTLGWVVGLVGAVSSS